MREPRNVDLRVIAVESPSPDGMCDVIFVHGLHGDPVKTWQHDPKHSELSFPRLLATDLPSVRVWALGYPAEKFGGKYARAMSIEDRAKSVLENFAAEGFGSRQIIFIAHSLGGLLVKQMLRAADESDDSRWRRIGDAVLGVVFLATPHAGSKLANVADALRRVLGPSAATLDLEQYSAKLLDLREWYSRFSVRNAIETAAFAETRPLPVLGIVVSEDSAWPGGKASTIRIDNVDHIQIARPSNCDATVYKNVLSNLRLWLAGDNDPRQVPLERQTRESDSEEISRFLFRTRRVPLFGRDDELRELQKFLDDTRQFTWCAVTGPGGSGKSRLALEFCLQLSPKWRAGFLKDWTSSEFREWTPNRPTLIVIDYVSARANDVGSIVRGLEGRSAALPFPVRLVLLERQGDGLWVREFLGAGEDRRTSTRSQYVSFPAEPNPPSNDPYDEVIRLQTLVVKPLLSEALWDCMSSVFNSSASNHTGRSNHADHKGKLLAQLLEIDPSRRPLFAAFFADAISTDPNMLEWDRKALVENVLRREQEKFWKPRGVTEVELDVLTLATLVRGIGYDCPDLPPAAHDSKQFSLERYAIACGVSASERLPPLEPDMVGEIFVLNRFRPSSKRAQAEEMRDRGWKIDSLEMSAFFSRAAKDFQDHPALWYLGSSPETASLRELYLWLLMAAEHLLPIYAADRLIADARKRAIAWYAAFWESYAELLALASGDKFEQSDTVLFARALDWLGYTLSTTGELERAIAVYDDLLVRFGDAAEPALRELVARAMFNKGITLGQLNRSEDEIAVYDDLLARFGDAAEPALREQVAGAMVNKGITLGQLNRSEDAIAVYDELLARFGDAAEPVLREQVARAMVSKGVTLGQLNRSEDEIAVYDDLLARFGDAAEPALREQVARAMLNKGVRLGQLNRSEDAIAVYDDLLARFGDAAEPALREQVARAMVNKGITLGQLNRSEDAIAVYDDLLARFGDAAEPALREQVARAMVNKGITLGQLNRSEDAIAVYDDLLARFGDAAEPVLREQVARAMLNKGVRLGQLNRSEDAIAVYDELLVRFGDAAEPALREQVARAMVSKGVRLGQLNRSEDEIAVYDELLARFGDAAEPVLRELVARAMFNKGITLGQLNRSEDEIAVYDELLARFGDAAEPVLREQVARAMVSKGVTLGQLNRSEDAIAVYDDLLARFGDAAEPALREQVARAMVNKGVTLGQLNRSEDAIAVYDDLLARFGDAAEPALREQVARAMVNKGVRLGQLNRSEDAIAVYDDLLARFGDAAEPALREQVARAMVNKGITLGQLNRSEDAIAVYDDLLARFGDAAEPVLREQVARAMLNKGVRLGQLNRSEDAIAVYDELLARFGDAAEPVLREQVARAMFNKGITLGQPAR